MPSGVISFRADEKDIQALRKKGVKANEFAKQLFQRGMERARLEDSIAWYQAHPFEPKDRRPVEKILREMRDLR